MGTKEFHNFSDSSVTEKIKKLIHLNRNLILDLWERENRTFKVAESYKETYKKQNPKEIRPIKKYLLPFFTPR